MPTKTVATPAVKDTMAALVEEFGDQIIPFRQGEIVEVSVISVSKQRILVDVQGLALGFVPFREFSTDSRQVDMGQKLLAYVLVPENEDGYAVLSLKRADRERLWRTVAEQMESSAVISVKISNANKGGLVIDYGGIEGFLPLSQLSSAQYSRLMNNGGEVDTKLRQMIGQNLQVKILSFDERARKLIFSEKAVASTDAADRLKQLEIGQKLEGTITGVVDFGLFVDIGEVEGLVHISEISWQRINDLKKLYKVSEKVDVEVIGLEDNRVSLSMKRLLPDPWQEAVKVYQVGQSVKGEITRITPYGAFVRLDGIVEGLVHISEIADRVEGDEQAIDQILEVGKSYPFIVLSIDPAAHRISLSYRSAQAAAKKTE